VDPTDYISSAVIGAVASISAAKKASFPSPSHKGPSSKILLKKDVVRAFAGKEQKSKLLLDVANGVILTAEKAVIIESKTGNV
jgi:hypothetical protein